jgi:hypothetical protein
MTIFTDADLDAFSDFATDAALKDTCEILREGSHNDDGEGGQENIDWPVFATVKCMLTGETSRSTVTEAVVADRLDGRTLQTVWFPRGTAVLKSDLLRINGQEYHIIDISTDSYEVLKPISVWRKY